MIVVKVFVHRASAHTPAFTYTNLYVQAWVNVVNHCKMPDWRPSCEQEGDRHAAEAAAEKANRTAAIELYFQGIENQDGETDRFPGQVGLTCVVIAHCPGAALMKACAPNGGDLGTKIYGRLRCVTMKARRLTLCICSEGELVLDMSQHGDADSVRAALVKEMGPVTVKYSDRTFEGLHNKHKSSAVHTVSVALPLSNCEMLTGLLGAAGDAGGPAGGAGEGEGDTGVQRLQLFWKDNQGDRGGPAIVLPDSSPS